MRAAYGICLALVVPACLASEPPPEARFRTKTAIFPAPQAWPDPASPPVDPTYPDSSHHEGHDDEIDDGVEIDETPLEAAPRPPHPWAELSQTDFDQRVQTDLPSLGSMSVGRPGAGALINGIQLPERDGWKRVDPLHAWGTQETIDYLTQAIGAVRAKFPNSHPLYVGHISARHGGPLSPHVSHQSGRDVDISYFYTGDQARWYRRAHANNLDRPRTWAFVKALITQTDVRLLLIDHSIQKLLQEHALQSGEDEAWVRSVFRGEPGKLRPLIVHARGHATHLHVRFYNPIAQETARRAYAALVKHKRIRPPVYYHHHKARRGDTLGKLAKRYRVTVRDIMRANRLRNTKIIAKRTYRIPRRGNVAAAGPVKVPARRLPRARPTTREQGVDSPKNP